MAREKNLADRLRKLTKEGQKTQEENTKYEAKNAEAKIATEATLRAKKLIASLPKQMENAAREGVAEVLVLDSAGISRKLYDAMRFFLIEYALSNGLTYSEREWKPGDEVAYDYLYFRWDKK